MKGSFIGVSLAAALMAFAAGCAYVGGVMVSRKAIEPSVTAKPFGTTKDGQEVRIYTLKGAGGMSMDVLDWGGKVVRLYAPDRDGNLADITLGFNDVAGYEAHDPFFGSLVGRYGNRIANGTFTLDGKAYALPVNNAPGGLPCSLHGGPRGFESYVGKAEPLREGKNVGLRMTIVSPDGDQGFPGTLRASVTYWLTEDNVWRIAYQAKTDKPTPVNLTQHIYFNLKGEGEGDILDHDLTLFAERMTPVNKGLIPTGVIVPVEGTPFDFRTPRRIGERINADDEQLRFGGGYDHNYVLDNPVGRLVKAAEVHEQTTGRRIEVWTTEPGVQFYTANHVTDAMPGKQGKSLRRHAGLALETQHAPDSPNQPIFPSTILRPNRLHKSMTEFRFGTF